MFAVNIPGCTTPGKVFVGQRKDPFVVNLGETFDLINIKAPATAFDPNAEKAGHDDLAMKNVTAIEMEVPTSCLTNGKEAVIGGWTTASLRQAVPLTRHQAAQVLHPRKVAHGRRYRVWACHW